jgi:hypothetical protein
VDMHAAIITGLQKYIRKLSLQSNTSTSSSHKRLHTLMKMTPYKIKAIHKLLPQAYVSCLPQCLWFVEYVAPDGEELDD